MNSKNISEASWENRSVFKFVNNEQHGPEAVFWIVVDALLLLAIVTGNSLSVAIILRTMRRRRHNLKSNFSEPLQPTHNTSCTRKHYSRSEGVNKIDNENPDSAPSQNFRPGIRSSSRFVLSLAISDLLVGLSMPFHMVFYIQGADGGGSPLMIGKENVTLGQIEWTCLLRFVLIALACSASACNLLAIAVDRYLAIVYPLHYCRYMTKRVAIAMIISCWGTALILATVPAYWNRWKTATLCELDDIFTPEYITCVVAPLFSAVVLALTILYWRIGKEARAQLKRLLGADGKGPPWKRFQNGKTYSSSISLASDRDCQRTQHGVNRTNKELNKTGETVSSFKDGRCLNGDQNIPRREKEIVSSSNIRKEIDELKRNSKLPHLQEIEEEHYPEEKGKSSNDNLNDSGIDQKKPNLKDGTNMQQEKTEICPTVKEVCSISKCQSDPNLVSYFEDEVSNDKKGFKLQKGLNNQVQVDSELANKTITARQSHFSPINNFTKGNQQITDNGSQKMQCGFQMNFLKREKRLTKRKSMDQTYILGTFNTMPKVMMANKMHFDKLPELTISLADFIKETNDTIDKNKTNNDNKDPPNKPETSKENTTLKITTKEALEEPKQNNLLKDSFEVRSHCHDEPIKFSPGEENQESISINIAGEFSMSENTPITELDEEEGENEGIERRASCMRSISSGCSSRGGHRNSTWNIRFPSLTSGNASIRPNVSKSTIVVLLVLGSFILLWLPYLTVSSLLVKGVKLPYTLYRLTFSLAMSNSGVNPIIYGWKNAELKRVFMRFVMSKWHRCTRRWTQRKEQEPTTETLNDYAPSIEISHIS